MTFVFGKSFEEARKTRNKKNFYIFFFFEIFIKQQSIKYIDIITVIPPKALSQILHNYKTARGHLYNDMSTLFLIGNPDITGITTETNFNEDFNNVLKILNESNCGKIFERRLVLPDLDSLFLKIYSDRLLPLPNEYNYETGIALIIYNSDKIVPQMNIRQLNKLFKQFFATLNVAFLDIGTHLNDDEILTALNDIDNDLQITRNRVLKMNHWMNHSEKTCSSNIYSMMRQFNTYNDDESINQGYEPIPRIIRNIDFEKLIQGHDSVIKDETKYIDLLSNWNFSALNLTTVELIQCGFYLIKKLSREANILITNNKLYLLLVTIELSYHQINKFHNFRHCIDVMQACWQICEYICPRDTRTKLLLALAATGHDIGHPGTNNSLFRNSQNELTCNSSILESFHYNIFNHLLGIHWNKINSLNGDNSNIIETGILATDMSLHSDYIKLLTEKRTREEFTLVELISIIIKAADISNVTRPLVISAKWALLITLEFGDCSILQKFYEDEKNSNDDVNCFDLLDKYPNKEHLIRSDNIDMDTEIKIYDILNETNFKVDNLIKEYSMIPRGQIFFIDTFAFEFFDKLSEIFPELRFLVDTIIENKKYWKSKITDN